jgi:hypothetical protein
MATLHAVSIDIINVYFQLMMDIATTLILSPEPTGSTKILGVALAGMGAIFQLAETAFIHQRMHGVQEDLRTATNIIYAIRDSLYSVVRYG